MNKIDERIVQMQFDNKQFEKGVHTSIDSLGKLKKSLDTTESVKQLNNLQKTAKGFSLADMSRHIEMISSRFTTMGIVGTTAIQNITNSAIESSKRLVKSFTLDPITQGFDEYEIKMNAIQTILTNTMSKGTTLKDVNASLGELNEYADQTIYNFAQMTDNIGKFTAAGVGLKDSVTSIKGLANMAAGFGVDAQRMAAATYQMSQAIAAGSVKLIDWNSLVQAGMGGEMTQKAFKETAKSIGIFVDESKPFRETLEQGWLTSEVFIKTMDKMAKDKSLLAAATNVTTFTKLLGTMKEAVASGWASTWELIFGNKDQSTELFTGINNAFSKFVGGLTDARNTALKFWNDFGGRADVLIGIGNILITIGNVLQPIQNLFSKLIPDITGENLVYLSRKFREFTEYIMISEGSTTRFGRILTGISSGFSIVGTVIRTVIEKIVSFGSKLQPITDYLINILATIGDFGSGINKIFDQFGGINLTSISEIGTLIKNTFTNIVLQTINGISEAFSKLKSSLGFVGKFEGLATSLVKIGDVLLMIVTAISNKLGALFTDKNFESFLSLGWLYLIKDIISSITGALDKLPSVTGFGEIVGELKGGLGALRGTLEALQNTIRARMILNIAIAVAVLAASLYLIGHLEPDKILLATTAIVTLFAQVAVITRLLAATTSIATFSSLYQLGGAMILVSTSVLILASAIKKLEGLKRDEIIRNLFVISALLIGVTKFVPLLAGTSKGLISFSLGLIGVALAIRLLTSSLRNMSSIPFEDIKKGVVAIGAVLLIIAGATRLMSLTSVLKTAVGIAILSTALIGLSAAIALLGQMDVETLAKGLLTIFGAILGLSLAFKLTKSSFNVLIMATSITVLAGGLIALSAAIAVLGSMSITKIITGVSTIAGVLVLFGAVSAFKYTFISSAVAISALSVSLVLLAGAMTLLTAPISLLGALPLKVIVSGLLTIVAGLVLLGGLGYFAPAFISSAVAISALSVSLGLLAGAMTLLATPIALLGALPLKVIVTGLIVMVTTLLALGGLGYFASAFILSAVAISALSVSLGLLAGAMTLLAVPLSLLGALPLSVIGIGLGVMVVSLLALGGVTYLLAPVIPMLLGLSGSIVLLGLGMVGIAASVSIFASALVLLAGAAAAIYAGLPLIGTALVSLMQQLKAAIPLFGEAMVAVLDLFIKMIPKIVEIFRIILDKTLEILAEYSPKFVDFFMRLAIDIANAIKKNEKEYIEAMRYIGRLLAREIKNIVIDVAKESLNIGRAVSNGIRAYAIDIKNDIKSWFSDDAPEEAKGYGKEIGTNIGSGGVLGIKETTPDVAKSASEMGTSALDAIKKAIDSNSPSEKTKDQGIFFGQGFINGINQTSLQANSSAYNMGASSAKALNDGWSNTIFGGAAPLPVRTEGFGGVSGLFKDLGGWFKDLGNKATKPIDDIVKKVSTDIPKTMAQGIQNGSKGSGGPSKAASDMGKQVKSAFDKSMEWIDEEKYYRRLSLQQELEAYTRMQSRYKIGSEERKKIDREIFRVKDDMTSSEIEVERKAYEHSKNWISDRKYYNELSLEEELAAWERVHARYSELSDEGKETAKEIYRVKNLLIDKEEQAKQKMFDNSKNWISEETSYDRDNMKERLDSWKRVLAREEQFYADSGKMNERLKEARLNVYNLTKSISEKEKNLIKEATDLKKRTIKEVEDLEKEHASKVEEINKKMNDDIKNLNEEYKNAVKARTEEIYNSFTLFEKLDKEINRNKEILKLKTDLVDAEKKLNSYSEDKTIKDVSVERDLVKQQIESAKNDLKVIQRVQKENRQGTSLRVAADKQAKTRNIELSTMVEKLESLNDTQKKYDELTTKRIESEKEILKIKEDIAAKEPVSGDQLIGNLEDQVKELKTWRQNLVALEQKGLNKDLLSELRDMGPKSMDELKALNRLTKPQLDNYAGLWLEKYRLAKTQATDELENMRIESLAKTDEIRTETIKTLSKLKEESGIKIKELNDETRSNLSKVKETWSTELGNVRSESRTTFLGIVTDTKEILKNAKLGESAKDALKGFNNGLKDGLPGVKKQTVILGEAPLESVAKALQINSPSKKMFELGLYTSQGFIDGIKSLSSSVVDESSSIGNNAVDSLKNIIIGIADFLSGNMDTTPTITPVLDLTNMKTGINKLNGIMSNGSYSMAQRARNVQSSQGAINSLVPLLETTGVGGESVNNTFAISNITIREEADIKRVARELYQLQISKNRG